MASLPAFAQPAARPAAPDRIAQAPPSALEAGAPAPADDVRAYEERIAELEARLRQLEDRLRALEVNAKSADAVASSAPAVAPAVEAAAAGTATPAAPALSAPVPQEEFDSPFPHTGPLSGYMDFHFNKVQDEDGVLDFHRFVLLFNHGFTERLRFVGELELEHALVEGLEEAGELELEQAYIDFLYRPQLNFRAGMVLAPVGLINERHEPPSFYGVERPFVDTFIIPSTWFDTGAGVHGALGRGFAYRAYLMAPLDATGFSADEGLRDGRQKGVISNVRNPAYTARLEYRGRRGLLVGSSIFRGKSGFNTPRFDTRVTLAEVDGRYGVGRLDVRGEYAHVFLDGSALLNDAIRRTVGVDPNIAREMRGFYLESAVHALPRRLPYDLAVFVRYENFDTQFRMPDGFLPLKQFDRSAWVFGWSLFFDPDVVLKLDYVVLRNRSAILPAPDAFNVGLGWWF